MAKLSKNATRILDRLQRTTRPYGASHHRPSGDGLRDFQGCEELVRKGFAVVVSSRETTNRHGLPDGRSITISLP